MNTILQTVFVLFIILISGSLFAQTIDTVYDANGLFEVPAGVTEITVQGWGGGGGGNAAASRGGGGGGGSYATITIPVAAGQVYSILIGAGGMSGNPGQDGGTTQFFSPVPSLVLQAVGGSRSNEQNGGDGGDAAANIPLPGSFSGGTGGDGSTGDPAINPACGGGGGSATSTGIGGNGADGAGITGGQGGTGEGAGGNGASSALQSGQNGFAPGGGGGGGYDALGGSGANGRIIISYQNPCDPPPSITCPSTRLTWIFSAPFELTEGSPAGGEYTGDFVTGGIFDPGAAGLGSHLVTYTINVDGCENVCTFEVVVIAEIPTMSEWGLIILALFLLQGIWLTIVFKPENLIRDLPAMWLQGMRAGLQDTKLLVALGIIALSVLSVIAFFGIAQAADILGVPAALFIAIPVIYWYKKQWGASMDYIR